MTAATLYRMLPRLRMGPASRVSLGLCSLMIACLLIVDLLVGILPDQRGLVRQLRERVSEQAATQVVSAMSTGDAHAARRALQEVLTKESELVSLAIRRKDGQ